MKFLQGFLNSLKKKPVVMLLAGFCFVIAAAAMAQTAAPTTAAAPAAAATTAAAPAAAATPAAPAGPTFNDGDTSWVLASAALVLIMTPGVAFLYGGMVRRKNVMGTIYQSFFTIALISVQWVVYGYSLAFSTAPGSLNYFIGNFQWFLLHNIDLLTGVSSLAPTIPHYAYMIFQAMFAIITPALITGSYAERVTFKGFVVFTLLWATFVYDPIAHNLWGGGYFGGTLGAEDFAGGTVVHMSSGWSGLIVAILLGARKGYGKEPMIPHNLTLCLLGASLLWFGWFGFNAGSAVAANNLACNAFVTTNTATAMGVIFWNIMELLHRGKATSLGGASGAVAGLVAITPACGYVDLIGSLWVGGVVSVICYIAVQLKNKFGYDDSLDAFNVHGIGGMWGALATGIWSVKNIAGNSGSADGLLRGNPHQFVVQLETVIVVAIYSLVVSAILYFITEKTVGMKMSPKDEELGMDLSQHGEEGYTH